jgi:lipopolysaccharide transport system ATP-binding protein
LTVSKIPSNLLRQGDYQLSLSIGIHNVRWIIFDKVARNFNVINIGGINKIYADQRPGVIMPMINWSTKLVAE